MNSARDYGVSLADAMRLAVEQARWNARIKSLRDLATRAGMTHTYLNNRMKEGGTAFGVNDLGALAVALGLEVGDLLRMAEEIASDRSATLPAVADNSELEEPGEFPEG